MSDHSNHIAKVAYWTHWLSCWAKRHELENRGGSREACYALKTRAIVAMLGLLDEIESAQGKVRHLRPPWLTWQPGDDPIEKAEMSGGHPLLPADIEAWSLVESLCPAHLLKWTEGGGFEPEMFLKENLDELLACESCGPAVSDYRNRNGLYHIDIPAGMAALGLEIAGELEGELEMDRSLELDLEAADLDFHLPFAKGKAAGLPEPASLERADPPRAHHGRAASRFRFGRPITDEEAHRHPEQAVFREVERLLASIEARP